MELEGLDESIEFGQEFQDQEFEFKKDCIFLNHGSYGATPTRIRKIQKRYQDEMNAHPDDWFRQNAHAYWIESRQAAAKFFHCDPEDLVFVSNATEGVNTVLKSYNFAEGDSILSSSLTYGAISLTCRDVAARNTAVKAEALDIQFPVASVDDVIQQYDDYLKSHRNTRIAVLDHITSPSSVKMPIKRLAQLCHNYGVLVMIDGAHAPGQVNENLEDLDVDFYTGNFHKWLYTPRGCAVLYVKRKHHDWVKPLVTSWYADTKLSDQFYMQGTRDQAAFFCAKYALEFYQRIGGEERILTYTSALANEAKDYLVSLLQTDSLQVPQEMEAPNLKIILLPKVPGYDEAAKEGMRNFLVDLRRKTNIQVATVTIQGRGYIRISANVYNHMDEYRKLGAALVQFISECKES